MTIDYDVQVFPRVALQCGRELHDCMLAFKTYGELNARRDNAILFPTSVFIEGVRAALTADAAFEDSWFHAKPKRGLRAMARVYARWGFSQAFFRAELDRTALGFSSLEEYIVRFWEEAFRSQEANNLLTMLWTWQNADISANDVFKGDYAAALATISAKAIVMPSQTELLRAPQEFRRPAERHPYRAERSPPANSGGDRFCYLRHPRDQSQGFAG